MNRGLRPPSQRQLRVGEELRHVIAAVLEKGDIRDPDVVGRAVTVTEVSVSPDLRNATVFISPLGGGDASGILAGLNRAKPYFRRELARMVRLRLVPNLHFLADTSFDYANHIENLLQSPEVSRDLKNSDEDGA